MSRRREPTVEWQVCGVCNYDCSYCIQSKKTRAGHPEAADVERFLAFFRELPSAWEVKMTGGEPFAFRGFMDRIIPGLASETPHTISVLTNLSAPLPVLARFAELTRGRLRVVSASLHLEHTSLEAFVEKARAFRAMIDPAARMVVNSVLVPGRLDELERARGAVEAAGLSFFPQIMKVKGGVFDYDEPDRARIDGLIGISPSPRRPSGAGGAKAESGYSLSSVDPRKANVAPSYRGRLCFTGVDYFVLTQQGDAFRCRTARRFGEGHLGNVLAGTFALAGGPSRCTYDICPCTVPANRGMIEGIGAAAEVAE